MAEISRNLKILIERSCSELIIRANHKCLQFLNMVSTDLFQNIKSKPQEDPPPKKRPMKEMLSKISLSNRS